MNDLKIFIITGCAGSGKSTALDAFEDSGFYCVDNMPIALLPAFLGLPIQTDPEIAGFAFVMDSREKGFLTEYRSILNSIRADGYDFEIIYLEAAEEILMKRFSETRRQHPLSGEKTLLDGIRYEYNLLHDLRSAAARIIDTSHFNVHELKARIQSLARKNRNQSAMRIGILSFGFKYGIPMDANLVMDVRFLTNPYFVPDLRDLDGSNPAVRKFVLNNADCSKFLKHYLDMLDYLIPLYIKEGKAYLTIAFGCTGGRHRSVAIATELYEYLKKSGYKTGITHRDIEL
ncbi:MAG: RNase adaptor protein RapZ [Desulfobacteraceae bacterium 4572_123]|nr:MAG: RNase adaptor protein RapZ [Desulfobacteraceae bacterium 4572_123]